MSLAGKLAFARAIAIAAMNVIAAAQTVVNAAAPRRPFLGVTLTPVWGFQIHRQSGDRYSAGSGSDRVSGARSLPLPVPYRSSLSHTRNCKLMRGKRQTT